MLKDRYICGQCGYNFDLAIGGFHTADVKTHCDKVMRVERVNVVEPPDPLEEKDAEIARLRHQITVKDAALHVAHDWLSGLMRNYHPVGEEEAVNAAIETALGCKGERDV